MKAGGGGRRGQQWGGGGAAGARRRGGAAHAWEQRRRQGAGATCAVHRTARTAVDAGVAQVLVALCIVVVVEAAPPPRAHVTRSVAVANLQRAGEPAQAVGAGARWRSGRRQAGRQGLCCSQQGRRAPSLLAQPPQPTCAAAPGTGRSAKSVPTAAAAAPPGWPCQGCAAQAGAGAARGRGRGELGWGGLMPGRRLGRGTCHPGVSTQSTRPRA